MKGLKLLSNVHTKNKADRFSSFSRAIKFSRIKQKIIKYLRKLFKCVE